MAMVMDSGFAPIARRRRAIGAPRNDEGCFMTETLKDFTGTVVLVGAGKMGGAMLEGWLALGLDPAKVAIREPQPAPEIAALAARGVRINPTSVGAAPVIVIPVKPQVAGDVVPALKGLARPGTVAVSVM